VSDAPGRLVLCPTPVGNLEDITLRVLRCLRECDVIFAEDTRVSEVLLRHFEVKKPVRSFHERVESRRLRELADLLASGKTVAVVTDAGMPGISDPGVELIRVARETSAAIEVLPGPSALLGALVLSGFDIGRFRFEGFPPRKASQRRTYLGTLRAELVAVVWYEAPSRVRELLGDIAAVLESRRVFVLREYTKKFEEQLIGTAADVLAGLGDPPRGEFVVVLEGASPADSESERVPDRVAAAMTLLLRNGVRPRLAVDALVTATGLHRNDLYALAQSLKAEE
jgi:16S rRNA (cytidine1402-2'-O)-methyltransferase